MAVVEASPLNDFRVSQIMKKLFVKKVNTPISVVTSDGAERQTTNADTPTNLGVNRLIVKHGLQPWLANWLSHTHGWGKDQR